MFDKVITKKNEVEKIFGRYVEDIFPSKEKAIELLTSGKKLTFYLGIDPTGPDIHLGNATNLLVLRTIMNLGHRVILLIGDFTAQTGDPTDKAATRKVLSRDQIRNNMETYLKQVGRVLKRNAFETSYNSKWLGKMTFDQLRLVFRQFTIQQLIARDMFKKRISEQKPITIEEFIYPLMQGYDSVAMNVDGEIGGTDQTFNMMIGRDLVLAMLKKEKIVITTKLLEDPITGRKIMNKSEGQYISLNDSPRDMFGKVMAMPDRTILPLFNLTTMVADEKIHDVKQKLGRGENPKDVKIELAYELVTMYHSPKEAERAMIEFERVFSKKELPDDIKVFSPTAHDIISVLIDSGMVHSKSEARHLIDQNGVEINGEKIRQWDQLMKSGDVIKIGPRRFLKIR